MTSSSYEEQPEAKVLSAAILLIFCVCACIPLIIGIWKVLLWAISVYGLPVL